MALQNHFWLRVHQLGDAFAENGTTFDERSASAYADFLTMPPIIQEQSLKHLEIIVAAAVSITARHRPA